MSHIFEVKFVGEVRKRFKFIHGKVCTKVVAESGGEGEKVGKREILFKYFVFDTDENFLLGSATREVAASGAMSSTSETEGLFAVDFVFDARFVDGFGVIIIMNWLV